MAMTKNFALCPPGSHTVASKTLVVPTSVVSVAQTKYNQSTLKRGKKRK